MWESSLVPEICDKVIEMGNNLQLQDANIGFESNIQVDKDYRRSKIGWIQPWMPEWGGTFGYLHHLFQEANQNAFGFDLWSLREIQFTHYQADNEGTYDWHTDLHWLDEKPVHRKLSMVVQLSNPEDYEGGDLELRPPVKGSPDPKILRKRGTAICFPSMVEHRVTPVTKGERYSLVAWFEGPKFR
jgi:PKHD-type hydroxylase